ncbi:unnamed protein product [Caenorhabditis sp. 36 PRJEB53466]|nr:unnamed protein product [Caenorhabditis sp. 36 PRJEB53466]
MSNWNVLLPNLQREIIERMEFRERFRFRLVAKSTRDLVDATPLHIPRVRVHQKNKNSVMVHFYLGVKKSMSVEIRRMDQFKMDLVFVRENATKQESNVIARAVSVLPGSPLVSVARIFRTVVMHPNTSLGGLELFLLPNFTTKIADDFHVLTNSCEMETLEKVLGTGTIRTRLLKIWYNTAVMKFMNHVEMQGLEEVQVLEKKKEATEPPNDNARFRADLMKRLNKRKKFLAELRKKRRERRLSGLVGLVPTEYPMGSSWSDQSEFSWENGGVKEELEEFGKSAISSSSSTEPMEAIIHHVEQHEEEEEEVVGSESESESELVLSSSLSSEYVSDSEEEEQVRFGEPNSDSEVSEGSEGSEKMRKFQPPHPPTEFPVGSESDCTDSETEEPLEEVDPTSFIALSYVAAIEYKKQKADENAGFAMIIAYNKYSDQTVTDPMQTLKYQCPAGIIEKITEDLYSSVGKPKGSDVEADYRASVRCGFMARSVHEEGWFEDTQSKRQCPMRYACKQCADPFEYWYHMVRNEEWDYFDGKEPGYDVESIVPSTNGNSSVAFLLGQLMSESNVNRTKIRVNDFIFQFVLDEVMKSDNPREADAKAIWERFREQKAAEIEAIEKEETEKNEKERTTIGLIEEDEEEGEDGSECPKRFEKVPRGCDCGQCE